MRDGGEMYKNPAFIIGLVIFVSLLLLANYFFPTSLIRYRMTIHIEMPDGREVSGSGVIQVQQHNYASQRQNRNNLFTENRVIGEAIIINSSKHGKIFALLATENSNQNYPHFIAEKIIRKNKKGEKILLKTLPPVFVTFTDTSDPTSIRRLSNKDFQLKSVTVEETDDEVTTEILKVLPWLATQSLVDEDISEELINIGWNEDFTYLPKSVFIQP